MVSERDIYASAYAVIKQHGDAAMDYAASRMQSLAEQDNLDGVVVWLDILHAIKDLETVKERKNLQ